MYVCMYVDICAKPFVSNSAGGTRQVNKQLHKHGIRDSLKSQAEETNKHTLDISGDRQCYSW